MFPDMPMHSFAHGMGGDVMEFFHNIFTNFKVATAFGTFANKIIHEEQVSDLTGANQSHIQGVDGSERT
jgi:hypothetical protein